MKKQFKQKIFIRSLVSTITVAPVLSVVAMSPKTSTRNVVESREYAILDILDDMKTQGESMVTGGVILKYARLKAFAEFNAMVSEDQDALDSIKEAFESRIENDPTLSPKDVIADAFDAIGLPTYNPNGLPGSGADDTNDIDDFVKNDIRNNSSLIPGFISAIENYYISETITEKISSRIDWVSQTKATEYGLDISKIEEANFIKQVRNSLNSNIQTIYDKVAYIDSTRPFKLQSAVLNQFSSDFDLLWNGTGSSKTTYKLGTENEVMSKIRTKINDLEDVNGEKDGVVTSTEAFSVENQLALQKLLGGELFDLNQQTHKTALNAIFPELVKTITDFTSYTISPTISLRQKYESFNDNYGFTTFTFTVSFDSTSRIVFTRKVKTYAQLAQIEKIVNIINGAFSSSYTVDEKEYYETLTKYATDRTGGEFEDEIDNKEFFDEIVPKDADNKKLSFLINGIDINSSVVWRISNKKALAKGEVVKIYADIRAKNVAGDYEEETIGFDAALSSTKFTIQIKDRMTKLIKEDLSDRFVIDSNTPKIEKEEFNNSSITSMLSKVFKTEYTNFLNTISSIGGERKRIEAWNAPLNQRPNNQIYSIQYQVRPGWEWGSSDNAPIQYTIFDNSYSEIQDRLDSILMLSGEFEIPTNNSVKKYYDIIYASIVQPEINGENIDDYPDGTTIDINLMNKIIIAYKSIVAEADNDKIDITYSTTIRDGSNISVTFVFQNREQINDRMTLKKVISVDNLASQEEIQAKKNAAFLILKIYRDSINEIQYKDPKAKEPFIEQLELTYNKFILDVSFPKLTTERLNSLWEKYEQDMEAIMLAAIAYQKEEILKELDEIFGGRENIPKEILDWIEEDFNRINDLLNMSKSQIDMLLKLLKMLRDFNAQNFLNQLNQLSTISKGIITGVAGVAGIVGILGASATTKSLAMNARLKKTQTATITKHKTWLSITVTAISIAVAVTLLVYVFVTKGGF